MAILISEIFAFLVILFVLYRFVWPLVRKMTGERQDAVQKQVEESDEAARRLEEAQQRLEAAEAEAREEAARIRDDARADSTRIREELTEQAHREVERIKQRGQEQLAAQREQMIRALRSELGGQSMLLAERVVVDLLSDDRRKSATVDSFLGELETMTAPSTDAGNHGDDNSRDDSREPTPAGGGMS